MLKRGLLVALALGIATLPLSSHAQKKLAQTGFQFLSVGPDARASAMADAFTTVEGSVTSIFYNPAGMARLASTAELVVSHTNWIADIKHYSLGVAVAPWGARYGVFGLSFQTVDYGEIQGTMVWGNPQGFVDTEVMRPSAIAVGIAYAQYLTDRFAVGGQIKEVAQSLGKSVIPNEGVHKNVASALAFDFGTVYRTGFKSLAFGMSVRNFSQEIKFEKEGFQLPLTFRMGISMNVLDFLPSLPEGHSLLMVVDAVHPRSYPEFIRIGTEYTALNTLSLRAGYVTGQDEYGLTLGFGLHVSRLRFDYAYVPFGAFTRVHRFTAHVSL